VREREREGERGREREHVCETVCGAVCMCVHLCTCEFVYMCTLFPYFSLKEVFNRIVNHPPTSALQQTYQSIFIFSMFTHTHLPPPPYTHTHKRTHAAVLNSPLLASPVCVVVGSPPSESCPRSLCAAISAAVCAGTINLSYR